LAIGVLVSCITACATCRFCREGRYGQCLGGGGWILGHENAEEIVAALTGGLGADVSIEAVGTPATFELAARLARPGGRIANIGVHGKPVTLHLEELWIRDITITTGLVDAFTTPTLLKLLTSERLEVDRFVTHHFTMDQFDDAYDVFARAAETGALKVVLTNTTEKS
jgi:alcohol dehydrogenase